VSPSTALVGQQVTFTVAGGSFVSFLWDFGDGTTGATTSTGSISNAYSTVGVHTASVVATDVAGAQATLMTAVTVNTISPTDIATTLTEADTPTTATVGEIVTTRGKALA